MSKKGENIYRRKDKRWEGRYRKGYGPDGKVLYGYVYGKSYAEVKEKLIQCKASVIPRVMMVGSSKLTVWEATQNWLQHQSIIVKPSTYSTYLTLVQAQILPSLGGIRVDKLTPQFVDQFIALKLETGKRDGKGGLSGKYVRDILAVLKGILRLAEQQYAIPNAAKYAAIPKVPRRNVRTLSEDERVRLEQYLCDRPDPKSQGLLICLYTGIRIGELCALHWCDISLDFGMLSVRATMQRIRKLEPDAKCKTEVTVSTPKTEQSLRSIPMPPFLVTQLKMLQETVRPKKEDFFLTTDPVRYIEPRAYQIFFKSSLRACQIPDINFHALRHTFATRCVEEGFDAKSLSEILGHASVEITLNRYVHSSDALKRRHMEKLQPTFK